MMSLSGICDCLNGEGMVDDRDVLIKHLMALLFKLIPCELSITKKLIAIEEGEIPLESKTLDSIKPGVWST